MVDIRGAVYRCIRVPVLFVAVVCAYMLWACTRGAALGFQFVKQCHCALKAGLTLEKARGGLSSLASSGRGMATAATASSSSGGGEDGGAVISKIAKNLVQNVATKEVNTPCTLHTHTHTPSHTNVTHAYSLSHSTPFGLRKRQ